MYDDGSKGPVTCGWHSNIGEHRVSLWGQSRGDEKEKNVSEKEMPLVFNRHFVCKDSALMPFKSVHQKIAALRAAKVSFTGV